MESITTDGGLQVRFDRTDRGRTRPRGRQRRGLGSLAAALLGLGTLAGLVSAAATTDAAAATSPRSGTSSAARATGFTDPTGGGHTYRHGAVPRIMGPTGSRAALAVPHSAAPIGGTVSGPTSGRTGSRAAAKLLTYGGGLTTGGLVGAGVTTGQPRVYLVIFGDQWGTEGTNGAGFSTFSGDTDGEALALQELYAGLGSDGELWSGIDTQYCDGVPTGSSSCSSATEAVPYPSGRPLAGVWYDNSPGATATAAAGASGHQLALEAEAAASHFGNTTQDSNRNTQYVVASPTGSNADGWTNPATGYCAYHDDTHDPTIDGGGAVPGPIVAFTNLPYVPDAGASCGAGSVNNPGTLDGATEAASHEYAETLTDQFPETNPAPGWTTSSGAEIGDLCAYVSAPAAGAAYNLILATGTVAVQGLWSNEANGGSGGCVQNAPVDHFTPTITSLSPTAAPVGASVTITGTNLSGALLVAFHGTPAAVASDNAGTIVAVVPAGVTPGTVSVVTPQGTATSSQVFTIPAPTIKRFTSGAVGTLVTITGTNLSGASSVAFNGSAAYFFDSATSVVALVPAGATTGPITIQTPGGTAQSVKSFSPVPTLTSFNPASGPPGTVVTLSGSGLSGVKKVAFNGKRAPVVSDSTTQVVVRVPTRASSGLIRVQTAGGTVDTASSFTVT